MEGWEFSQAVRSAYAEAVHWRRNVFQVPSGGVGKDFVLELTRLYNAYAEGSALESIALTAAMLLPILLLQKPHAQSKAKDHALCLSRRLKSWRSGDIDGLMREGQVIQLGLPPRRTRVLCVVLQDLFSLGTSAEHFESYQIQPLAVFFPYLKRWLTPTAR